MNDTDKLDLIINLLNEIKIALEPETYTWKLKDKKLLTTVFFDKLNKSQKIKYLDMFQSIAKKNGLETRDVENWPTDPLRHLFYSSCKWIGIKDGESKKTLSREIFEITSSKRGQLDNKNSEKSISLFGEEDDDVRLF